ncbi:glycosyltransferase [Paracoccus alkenifer]|uniref:glycosyltransferase n=1 Tax=Paracoccus alkenifer TaxID=65735 RepID=UPI0015A6A4DD|nr:glycosyltransferase [Paracoccus alkenifer]
MTDDSMAAAASLSADGEIPLRDIPVVIVTRFSFFGKSGWKSDASRDRELLFQPQRLEQRLRLFS